MAPKTKGGNGKLSKKDLRPESEKNLENVGPTQGGTVMVRSPWDCRRMTAQYMCDFTDTALASCGNPAIS